MFSDWPPGDVGAAERQAALERLYEESLKRASTISGSIEHWQLHQRGMSSKGIVIAAFTGEDNRASSLQVCEAPLSKWHSRSWTKPRRIAFVGDSTTSHMNSGPIDVWANQHICAEGELPETSYRVFGASGNTLREFNQNFPPSLGLADVLEYHPDLIVLSYGINDVRFGHCSIELLISLLTEAVTAIHRALPDCDVILRTPNALLSTGINIAWNEGSNAVEASKLYSDIMHDAYAAASKAQAHVMLYDSQNRLFGGDVSQQAASMADDIHPQYEYYTSLLQDLTVNIIGRSTQFR